MPPRAPLVVADTSVLINFLVVGRMDLISRYDRRVLATEHVAAEITVAFAAQRRGYEDALMVRGIEEVRVDGARELALFTTLITPGRLGAGECSAIAIAVTRGHALAIDDRRAARQASALDASLEVLGTRSLMVEMIGQGLITLAEADLLLIEWATHFRFKFGISSFGSIS